MQGVGLGVKKGAGGQDTNDMESRGQKDQKVKETAQRLTSEALCHLRRHSLKKEWTANS
jgi:hypothetical protein